MESGSGYAAYFRSTADNRLVQMAENDSTPAGAVLVELTQNNAVFEIDGETVRLELNQ